MPMRARSRVSEVTIGVGADFKRPAVLRAGNVTEQLRQQRGDDVLARLPAGVGSCSVPDGHRCRERQGKGVATGEGQQYLVDFRPQATRMQQPHAVLGGQVPQRRDVEQVLPPGVGRPVRVRRSAPGNHYDTARGQAGHELLPQPVVQTLAAFEGVTSSTTPGSLAMSPAAAVNP